MAKKGEKPYLKDSWFVVVNLWTPYEWFSATHWALILQQASTIQFMMLSLLQLYINSNLIEILFQEEELLLLFSHSDSN